jgi:replicative DNA helicase
MQAAAHAAAQASCAVGVCSLEMSGEQLAHRLVSGHSGVDSHRLRTGYVRDDEWRGLMDSVGELARLPIWFDDTPQLSLLELRARVRRLAAETERAGRRLGLLIVDYLQLLHAPVPRGEGRVQEVAEISRGLKALAKEVRVPVLACAQLSRAADQRAGGRPQLSDLRESGQLEADADLVLFLYREELYDPHTPRKGLADLIVAKHRSGPLADIALQFDAATTRFAELEERRHADDR